MNFGEIISEAENIVRQHPEQARSGLDKAEEVLDERTGGRHGDQLKKGEAMLEDKLGLEGEAPATH